MSVSTSNISLDDICVCGCTRRGHNHSPQGSCYRYPCIRFEEGGELILTAEDLLSLEYELRHNAIIPVSCKSCHYRLYLADKLKRIRERG